MFAVLFVVALFGYAIAYTGVAKLVGAQRVPGILESLRPSYSGYVGGTSAPAGLGVLGDLAGSFSGGTEPTPGQVAEATPQVRTILAALGVVPGWSLIRICGPGSVAASEHPHCNAADVGGPRPVLMAVQLFLLAAARSRSLPVHCIIGPDSRWPKGAIRSRESRWVAREYTGPNSHQTHVHVSGWPSVGGGY